MWQVYEHSYTTKEGWRKVPLDLTHVLLSQSSSPFMSLPPSPSLEIFFFLKSVIEKKKGGLLRLRWVQSSSCRLTHHPHVTLTLQSWARPSDVCTWVSGNMSQCCWTSSIFKACPLILKTLIHGWLRSWVSLVGGQTGLTLTGCWKGFLRETISQSSPCALN